MSIRQLGFLVGPLLIVSTGILALLFLSKGGETQLIVDENSMGPVSWPRVMLIGVIISGFCWALTSFRTRKGESNDTADINPQISYRKLALGLLTIVGYGTAMVYIGFALATFLFLFSWLLFGGLRFYRILINSVMGTLATLYLFLKVAYLPLPRGLGVFDTMSVNLYQFLGIF